MSDITDLDAAVTALATAVTAEGNALTAALTQNQSLQAEVSSLTSTVTAYQQALATATQQIEQLASAAAAATPPSQSSPALTKTAYIYSGSGEPDPAVWPSTGYETTGEPPQLLYYYVNDINPGDANGIGLDGVWTVYTGAIQLAS